MNQEYYGKDLSFVCEKTKTIYVVVGKTGEYADYQEWYVCAYPVKRMAEQHCKAAQEEDTRLAAGHRTILSILRGEVTNKYDPNYSRDYTGTTYEIHPIKLFPKFDENRKWSKK